MPVPVVQILEAKDYAGEVKRIAQMLADGKIVVLPTETVYGAAALINRGEGRERLKALRGGSTPRALVPHVASTNSAEAFLGEIGRVERRMMEKLWPGPVGLQFDVPPARRSEVAAKLGAHESDLYDGTAITLRLPDHVVFNDVALAADGPVAATAVGEPGRFDADKLAVELEGKVDLIVSAGPPRFSKPSTLVKFSGEGYHVVRAGVYDERTIRRLMMTTILFVCSGNTCRSPMAEAIAKLALAERLGTDAAGLEQKGFEVTSAGASAMGGGKATPQAVEAVKSMGGDLSRHRSRALTAELIHQADVIYTMTKAHSRVVTAIVPAAAKKVAVLDSEGDIDDPIGGDIELYNGLAHRLRVLIESRLREKILP